MTTAQARAKLAAMKKKQIVDALCASNEAFSRDKLNRKTRDDLLSTYEARLVSLLSSAEQPGQTILAE